MWIPDEKSARIKHQVLLALKLRKLEEERDLRDNPKPGTVRIAIPRKKGATSASTPAVVDADDRVSSLIEEVDRMQHETARLQSLLDETANRHKQCTFTQAQADCVYTGTTLSAQNAEHLRRQINNRSVPLPDIISFFCRAAIDCDAWVQALVYVRGVLTEGMHTGDFIINGQSFTEGDRVTYIIRQLAYIAYMPLEKQLVSFERWLEWSKSAGKRT